VIDGFLLSFQFLTRLPIRKNIEFDGENIRKSIGFFPLVGLVIGSISTLVYFLLSKLSKELASFLAVFTMIGLTGGLHLDGLSDSFDGFFSYRDREECLEIMKDSRIGAFGVIAIVFDIGLKYILVGRLGEVMALALALSLANSRLVVAYVMSFKDTAKDSGLGSLFKESSPKNYFFLSLIVYLLVLVYLNPLYILPLMGNFLLSAYITRLTGRKIGGYTGDVYGMLIELGDIVSMLVFLGVVEWIL